MGPMIVAFHRVWSGPGIVLTIFGILNLLKAAQCFLLPGLSVRMMNRVSVDRSGEFIAAGVVALAVSATTAYALVRSP